jgi:hypothetical protein
MAKQFLDCPEVAAGFQQMGGEAVPQGMGRRTFRQAQSASDIPHAPPCDAIREGPATFTQKKRIVSVGNMWAGSQIGINCRSGGREHRYKARFAGFADDSHCFREWRCIARQAKRFTDAEPCCVEQ